MDIYVFAALFSLFGILLFRTWLRARRQINASQQWVSTPGRIEEISYREHMKRSKPRFRLKMNFVYTVGGRTFEADESRIAFSQSRSVFRTREAVEKAIAAWKTRDPLAVFHDPANPANCVLEREKPGKELPILLFALLFLAFGAGLLAHRHWDALAPFLQ